MLHYMQQRKMPSCISDLARNVFEPDSLIKMEKYNPYRMLMILLLRAIRKMYNKFLTKLTVYGKEKLAGVRYSIIC
jgi:hypothetical protein